MALNATKVQQVAKELINISNLIRDVEEIRPILLTQNSNLSIPWGDSQAIEDINEELLETDGNLRGFNCSPAQLANVIGSLAALQTFMDTHLQNFLLVADPK